MSASNWLRFLVGPQPLRSPAFRRWLLLLAIALPLSFVPMAGTLGYFSGLLLSPVYSVIGLLVGVDQARSDRARPLVGHLLAGLRELAMAWGVVLVILLLGTLWNRNCDPLGGFAYFFMGPMCSSMIGVACGLAAATAVAGRAQAVALAMMPMLVCVVIGVHRLYTQPVVFAFDPFWGWFSGPIYDETVGIDRRYVQYRLYNGVWVLALLLALRACRSPGGWNRPTTTRERVRLGTAVLAAIIGMFLFARSDDLQFTATHESIEDRLSQTRETEHFVIHYAPRGDTAREIDAIAAEHEFAWSRLSAMLGREPAIPVHSYIFSSKQDRRRWLGAGRPEVSLPWKGEMYLSHRPFPHNALHHELAHAFLGPFGDPVFGLSISGARINIGLVEGVPTALAPKSSGRLDLHDQAAALDRIEKRPSLAGIMGLGFWSRSSSRAYTAAGSFTLWLRQTRGPESVAELYANAGDFEATYGQSLESLESEWLEFIRARPVRDEDVAAIAQRYTRRSVFRRPCAHRVAELSGETSRARKDGHLDEAREGAEELCALEPEDPNHRLTLAHIHAEAAQFEQARNSLDDAAAIDDLTDTVLARIDEYRGDVALLAGDLDTAEEHYAHASSFGVSESTRRVLQLKLLGARDPELADILVRYFATFDSRTDSGDLAIRRVYLGTRIAQGGRHTTVGRYLAALQLHHAGELTEARPLLRSALEPGPGETALPTAEITRAARTLLLSIEVRLGNFDEARAQLRLLRRDPDIGNGHRLDYARWSDRIDFFEAYGRASTTEG